MLCSFVVQSQYHPLLDSNSTWSVRFTVLFSPIHSTAKYNLDGDSLINGEVYQKLVYTTDSVGGTSSLYALLKEDTMSQRVYGIIPGDSIDKLLYDFSLQKGDTVELNPFASVEYPHTYFNGAYRVVIDSVDSVWIGNELRRRLIVSNIWVDNHKEFWIEGIGSERGLLGAGTAGQDFSDGPYPTLLCFENDGVLLYQDSYHQSCFLEYTSVNDINFSSPIDIYPNPVKDHLTIENEFQGKVRYKLVSVAGRLVKQGLITENTLDLTNLESGMYFLRLYSGANIYVKRLYKAD